jgi:hypothetical protein
MKNFFLIVTAIFLYAGSYVTLDSGKTIYLKDDGTWEEVNIIKKNSKTIALKKDGTWEEVDAKDVEAANIVTNKIDEKFKNSKLGKALLGRWESVDGSLYLTFTPQKAEFKKRVKNGFKKVAGKWRIENIDEDKRRVVVNIAEGARLGFLTFGGVIRKLRFSEDLNTLYDESEKIERLKIYKLHKVK